jgi:hypothetical protein
MRRLQWSLLPLVLVENLWGRRPYRRRPPALGPSPPSPAPLLLSCSPLAPLSSASLMSGGVGDVASASRAVMWRGCGCRWVVTWRVFGRHWVGIRVVTWRVFGRRWAGVWVVTWRVFGHRWAGVRVVTWRVRRRCWAALMGVAASTSTPRVSPNVGSHRGARWRR